ncbi:DUF3224 domain-containing protein [Streptomyces sp. NPDC001231]|uniref:DUF3224 domain-containing protein n=1 Tax=Streptomyces sp. NPDC001231 TaxID=3364549 RepID=UPI0036C674B1
MVVGGEQTPAWVATTGSRDRRRTSGTDHAAEFFTVVPAGGTGEPAGITGSGGLALDADGTHRIWFDYELD